MLSLLHSLGNRNSTTQPSLACSTLLERITIAVSARMHSMDRIGPFHMVFRAHSCKKCGRKRVCNWSMIYLPRTMTWQESWDSSRNHSQTTTSYCIDYSKHFFGTLLGFSIARDVNETFGLESLCIENNDSDTESNNGNENGVLEPISEDEVLNRAEEEPEADGFDYESFRQICIDAIAQGQLRSCRWGVPLEDGVFGIARATNAYLDRRPWRDCYWA